MADLTHKESSGTTRIVGSDEIYAADVILEDGIRKLATTKKVNVESLSGVQEAASNWLSFEDVATGDTLRVEIDATDSSPAYDQTFTVLAGEDRFDFAARVVLEQNQDFTNFQPYFKATQVKNNSVIFYEAKTIAEAGENITQNSFRVTGTGTLNNTLIRGFDNWQKRTSVVQASKSSKDPRLAVFGIEGTVESRDASVEGLFVQQPYNGTPANIDLNINGGAGTVFTFPMDALNDIFVTEIKFFGRDNGIQFGNKFLGANSALTNGIKIEIKTDNNTVELPLIKTTDDFDDKFSFGGPNFTVYFASGEDKFTARFLSSAYPLRRSGTFGAGNDDYIRITIRDNLTSINYLQAVVVGFTQEA